ncbi:MAG: dihydrolipoyl dehydrogenase [Desulfobacterales bacterium]|nr:MAG: dihydrolipoyl dehydrogenase [Desulfobacterales bacterium]
MHDLAIIGGGPGGYVAAIKGAQRGLKVLLVEKDALGGTCLNRGCVPTKSFVYDAKLLQAARTSPVLRGAAALTIDPVQMVARKRKVVKTLVEGLGKIIRSHGIDIARGKGQLTAPGQVRVHPHEGPAKAYQARHIILASGSKPAVPAFIDVDGQFVQTTDEALEAEDVPANLIIIGGGVIGMEMAGIYLNLGATVTIVEMLPDILLTEDQEIREMMRRLLAQRGAAFYLQAQAKELTRRKDGVELTFADASGAVHALRSDRILVATGRAPVLEGIAVKKLGLKMEGPYLKVNSRLQTNLPGIYAVGDLVGGRMLAHKAAAEAEAAVDNILGANRGVRPEKIPRCIWGLAEIGAVGLTEEEARATRHQIKVGRFPFTGSAAARAMGNIDGLAKIVGDAETGEILGVHIIGAHATDLIGDAVTTMTMESAVEDLAAAIKPHPTLSETLMEAALDWSGLAIHTLKKRADNIRYTTGRFIGERNIARDEQA